MRKDALLKATISWKEPRMPFLLFEPQEFLPVEQWATALVDFYSLIHCQAKPQKLSTVP